MLEICLEKIPTAKEAVAKGFKVGDCVYYKEIWSGGEIIFYSIFDLDYLMTLKGDCRRCEFLGIIR